MLLVVVIIKQMNSYPLYMREANVSKRVIKGKYGSWLTKYQPHTQQLKETCIIIKKHIVPMLCIGMREWTLQRPVTHHEDARASSAALQRRAL